MCAKGVCLSGVSRTLDGMTWRLGRRPALDGIRGLAILFVLLAHFDHPARNPLTGAGHVGVTLFFGLSGFLITSLLLEELERTDRVSLRAFYRRRAARLLPAILAVLAFVAVVQIAWRPLRVEGGMLLAVAAYGSNLWQLATSAPLNGLSHTWSLAIEEQFYLVWPLLVILAARWGRRGIGAVGVVGMLVSVAAVMTSTGQQQQWGSLERASSLLAGCLLAVWISSRPEGRGSAVAVGVGFAAMVPLWFLHGEVDPLFYLLGVPAVTALILWGASGAAAIPWLPGRVLRWFGQRSYGIYLWHYPILFAFPLQSGMSYWGRTVFVLAVSLGVAELSWRLIERPIMARWSRSGDAGDAAEELIADNPDRGSSPRAGEEPDVRRGQGFGQVRAALDPAPAIR